MPCPAALSRPRPGMAAMDTMELEHGELLLEESEGAAQGAPASDGAEAVPAGPAWTRQPRAGRHVAALAVAALLLGSAALLGVANSGMGPASTVAGERSAPAIVELAHEDAGEKSSDEKREEDERKTNKEEEEKAEGCAASGAGCMKSKCCKDAGYQCYTKDQYWAQCMANCTAGPNPRDQTSNVAWECKALGKRTPGEATTCSVGGEDCSDTKCCLMGGTTCYRKNANYAACKPSCTPGPDLSDDNSDPWDCTALGPKAMGAAPWVREKCATGGEDCATKACCANPGDQCFRQTEYYAQCKPSCKAGEKLHEWDQAWSCETVGSRTPAFASDAGSQHGTVGQWVAEKCSSSGGDCHESKCCHSIGAQCYRKNEYWASCKPSCSTEPDPEDNNKTWTCDELGPRSWGLALKGWPSLYCFHVMRVTGYEPNLTKAQLNASAGIFACDGYDLLADGVLSLGFPPGKTDKKDEVVTIESTKGIEVGVSQDGTAGNAKLFMKAWDTIIANGRFRDFDWTIKVDPDAVLIAWRVRDHMRAHVGESVYVVNCNKFPSSPNFPMMFGAVEVFSAAAMNAYAAGSWKCGQQLPWGSWGEDYYMTHCMDFLGVGRIGDFAILGDNMCTGANCADTFVASFHPFKDIGSWFQCWGQATAPGGPPSTR